MHRQLTLLKELNLRPIKREKRYKLGLPTLHKKPQSAANQDAQTGQSLINKTGETLQSFASKTGEALQKINPLK
jgi:Tfp pilus assembly protein PilE